MHPTYKQFMNLQILIMVLEIHSAVQSVLLSQGKNASQSSNHNGASGIAVNATAEKAVDGNTDQLWAGGSCIHTDTEGGAPEAWWIVDLGALYRIENIIIWNRDENDNRYAMRLYKFQIGISNTTNKWTVCYTDDNEMVPVIITITSCNKPETARYVRIYRDQVMPGTRDDVRGRGVVLNICEFQVFGCTPNMFGTNSCDNTCGCATGCDPTTGFCDAISSSQTTSLITTASLLTMPLYHNQTTKTSTVIAATQPTDTSTPVIATVSETAIIVDEESSTTSTTESKPALTVDKSSPTATTKSTTKATITTATPVISTTSSSIQQPYQQASLCECPCIQIGDPFVRNITQKELNAAVVRLKEVLFINKSQLSSTKRKLTSAGDARYSSYAIGCIGVFVLTSVGAIIILADISRVNFKFLDKTR